MIRIQPGRGGLRINAGAAGVTAMALMLVFAIAGCSSKTTKPTEGLGAEGGAGLGEKGTGAGGSSLTDLQKGTLGGGEQGPLHDIHFGYNDYTIEPQDGSVLKDNAQWLTAHPASHVQIEGHCDERGSEEYNMALGAKRAQAAKDYLVTLGVPASRLSTISYGKELPLCTEHDESCWSRNRRAHFVVGPGA